MQIVNSMVCPLGNFDMPYSYCTIICPRLRQNQPRSHLLSCLGMFGLSAVSNPSKSSDWLRGTGASYWGKKQGCPLNVVRLHLAEAASLLDLRQYVSKPTVNFSRTSLVIHLPLALFNYLLQYSTVSCICLRDSRRLVQLPLTVLFVCLSQIVGRYFAHVDFETILNMMFSLSQVTGGIWFHIFVAT